MTRGKLCRAGLHDDWRRIEVDRPVGSGWYYRCVPCLRVANAASQRRYAARCGEEFLRKERRRKKIKRWAQAAVREEVSRATA